MAERLELGICPTYAAEFHAALEALGFLDLVVVRARRTSCRALGADGAPASTHPGPRNELVCSPPRHADGGRRARTAPEQCLHLLGGRTLVDALQAGGAYVVSSGWVGQWRERLAAWGFDQAGARAFFAETVRRCVLLDTGVVPDAAAQAAAFCAWVDRPLEVLCVGLEPLTAHLRVLVSEWQLERERAAARESARKAADLSLALDFLPALHRAPGEAEVMGHVLQLFATLFAPGRLAYQLVESGRFSNPVPADAPAAVVEAMARLLEPAAPLGEDGLITRLTAGGQPVAVVWVGELGVPGRRNDSLNLAWSLAELLGAALAAVRTNRRHREVERELRHAQKLEAVGRLAAGVAHEINTPTQFLLNNLVFLQEATTSLLAVARDAATRVDAPQAGLVPERAALSGLELDYLGANLPAAVAQSLDGVERITTIVRSLQEFAQPSSERGGPVDLNARLLTVLALLGPRIRAVAELELLLEPELPPVWGAVAELHQAFLGLLENAVEAIAARPGRGGKPGRLTVQSSREADGLLVRISDDGLGIAPAQRDHLFEPFFTTKPVGQGPGLGLSLARRVLVEQHGGTLTFDSTPGEGTTFFVRLPFASSEVSAPAAAD